MSILSGTTRNLSQIKGKYLPSSTGLFSTHEDLEGYGSWTQPGSYPGTVQSPYFIFSGYKYAIILTRSYGTGSSITSNIVIKGTSMESGLSGMFYPDKIYDHSGNKLDSISPRSHNDIKGFTIIDVGNIGRARIEFDTTEAHTSTNRIAFNILLTNENPLNDIDNLNALTANTESIDTHVESIAPHAESIDNQINDVTYIRFEENIYDAAKAIIGEFLADTGNPSSNMSWGWSNYLPCKEQTTYSRNKVESGGASGYYSVYFYDSDKALLGGLSDFGQDDRALIFTTPANAAYMGANIYREEYFDYLEDYCVVEGAVVKNIPSIGKSYPLIYNELQEINAKLDKQKGDELSNINGVVTSYGKRQEIGRIAAMLNDSICLVSWNDGTILHLSEEGWSGDFMSIDTSVIDGGTLRWALFVQDGTGSTMRLLLCFDYERVYHNHAPNVDDWAESNFWGLPNTLNPDDATTTTYNEKTRPKYYKPSVSELNYRFMGGSVWREPQMRRRFYLANYVSNQATPSSVWETKDGKDFFCQYQFGIHASSPESKGKNVDVSGITDTLPSDIKAQQRTPVLPSHNDKDPANSFEFSLEIDVSGITDDAGRTKVNAVGHGLSDNDIVCFRSAEKSENQNDWLNSPTSYADLLNNTAVTAWDGATPPGGNGKFYKIEVIDADNFYIHEAIGNPHNNFQVRHIHGIDLTQAGIVISTGDSGGESPLILIYMPAIASGNNMDKVQGDYGTLHLTASALCVERAIGFWMNDEYFLFASDSINHISRREKSLPEGRTESIYFSSGGIYKGTLTQLDEWSATELVLEMPGVAYLFKRIGSIFLFNDRGGMMYISRDKGESWQLVNHFNTPLSQWLGHNSSRSEIVIGERGSVSSAFLIELTI